MNRKIIGLIIIIVGFGFMAALVYFVLLGNSFSSVLELLRITSVTEESALEAPAENTNQPESTQSGAIQRTDNEVRRITIDELDNTEVDEQGISDPAPFAREFNKDDIRRMASSFAERFGSYSNQSNFANILDLKIFMTRKMKDWADSYVAENRAVPQGADIYFGITTSAIAEEIEQYDDDLGFATILVFTRRQEARVSRNNVSDIYDQRIEIALKKENGAWKVDHAFWQEK